MKQMNRRQHSMKKIKSYLCAITSISSFAFLMCATEYPSKLLFSFIYIILLSTTYLLAHSIKKDKQLNAMYKPKFKKFSFVYKIITVLRICCGIFCSMLALSYIIIIVYNYVDLSLATCLFYTFALLAFVLLKKRTPNISSTQCKAPTVSSTPETHTEYTKDTIIKNPPQLYDSSSNSNITDKLNESKELLQSSLKQLNKITTSEQEAITVKIDSPATYPPEALASMRTAYCRSQTDNDIRILNDCINIMNSTSNLETFFSRYETAMQTALSLQMAKEAGITVNTTITPSYVSSLKSNADHVLETAYAKELNEINALKTPTGKRNRIDKFLKLLSEYADEFEFSDVYSHIVDELNMLKQTV